MTYPFVPAGAPDYGVRKGPALGLLYHMAEGGNTVKYLAGKPARGVSVHAVCEYSGRVVQMLHWDRASGSLNPKDTSTDKAYYGHSTLVAVLGDWWDDPNSAVLSMEIEGFAAKGPNPAQVDGAIAWGEDMKGLFSSLRGAIGHADQTNTKGCPGTSLSMKLIFEGVGGHGLWHPQGGPQIPEAPVSTFTPKPGRLSVKARTPYYAGPDESQTPLGRFPTDNDHVEVLGAIAGWRVGVVATPAPGDLAVWIPANQGTDLPLPPAPPVDCTNAVAAEHERTLKQAKDALEAIP